MHLKNGDRISGEVKRLERGVLTVKTEWAGTLKIKWDQITGMESEEDMKVYFRDKTNANGVIKMPKEGEVQVLASEGERKTAKTSEIAGVNIDPDAPDIVGHAAIGWEKVDGNTDTESFHYDLDLMVRWLEHRWKLYTDFNWAEADGETNKYNWKVNPTYDYFFSDDLYLSSDALFQRDRFQDLSLRTLVSVGPGWQVFNCDDLKLSVSGGPGYAWERYESIEDRDYPAGRWSVDFSWWPYKKYAEVYHNQLGFQSLDHIEDTTVQTRTGIRIPLWKAFLSDSDMTMTGATSLSTIGCGGIRVIS